MAEIDIQQMIKDYNRILQKDYYGPYAKYDTLDQQARGNLDLLDEIKKFKQRYGAVEENFSLDDMPAKATLLKIEQNGKDIILPNFNSSNFTQMNGEDKVFEEMFESGHKEGDLSKDIKLDRPAIFTFDENGQYIKEERGKLTLYDGGSYYFRGGNATTSSPEPPPVKPEPPSEPPPAKPEPSPETPVNTKSPSEPPSEKPHTNEQTHPEGTPEKPVNTESRQYDFNSAKEKLNNIQDAVRSNGAPEETKELISNVYDARERITELKEGTFKRSYDETVLNLNSKLNKINSQMTDLIADKDVSLDKKLVKELKKNFIDTQDMDEVVTESKFNLYRENFNKIRKGIKAYEGAIKHDKDSFKEVNIDVESKEIKKYFGKIEEAKKEYRRIMKEQNKDKLISGEKPQKTKFLNEEERDKYKEKKLSERNNYIAEKVFGGTEYNNTTKMGLINYYESNKELEKLKKIKENLGSKIEGMMDKEGNFSYKKAVESSKAMGWKGKAAIFGGVALGALSLVGVASMVMSGGRQQNSNLYNPYQAMY